MATMQASVLTAATAERALRALSDAFRASGVEELLQTRSPWNGGIGADVIHQCVRDIKRDIETALMGVDELLICEQQPVDDEFVDYLDDEPELEVERWEDE